MFTEKDFAVFTIDGFTERMSALIETIRPKLTELGTEFAPTLSVLTGDEMFAHVAKHARRTVNPPKDTWVAFAPNKRGYKMLPHFQIVIWPTYLYINVALIYECPQKAVYGERLSQHVERLLETIPSDFMWSGDHTEQTMHSTAALGKDGLLRLFNRLQTVKKGELQCGLVIERDAALQLSEAELSAKITETFTTLLPIYQIEKN